MLEAVSRSRGFFGSVPQMPVAMRGVCTPFWTGWPIMRGCWELFLPCKMPCVVRSSQLCFYFIKLL